MLDSYDYSKWLGPDYLKTQELPARVSTVVCAPHQSFPDDLILVGMPFFPSFAVKSEMSKIPVLASILAGNRSFYIERGAGVEGREKTV